MDSTKSDGSKGGRAQTGANSLGFTLLRLSINSPKAGVRFTFFLFFEKRTGTYLYNKN